MADSVGGLGTLEPGSVAINEHGRAFVLGGRRIIEVPQQQETAVDAFTYGCTPSASPAQVLAALQRALDEQGEVTITRPGRYLYSDTLYIGDNTRFVIGRGVKLEMYRPGSSTDGRLMIATKTWALPDITITTYTSAGTTGSITTAAPHGLVAGDYAAIRWAKPAHFAGVFRVLTAPTATTLTVQLWNSPRPDVAGTDTATATAGTGGVMRLRKATVNVRIENYGELDYTYPTITAGPNPVNGHMCLMFGVFNYYVSGAFNNAAQYGVMPVCAAAGVLENIVGSTTHGNAVQAQGPINGLIVNGVTGKTTDNLTAFGGGDYSEYLISEGAITGLEVRNVRPQGLTGGAVRLWGTSEYPIDFVVDGVYGSTTNAPLVELVHDAGILPDANSYVRQAVIRNIKGTAKGAPLVTCACKTADKIVIENIENLGSCTTGTNDDIVIDSAVPQTLQHVIIRNHTRPIDTAPSITSRGVYVGGNSTVKRIQASGVFWRITTAVPYLYVNGGIVDDIEIADALAHLNNSAVNGTILVDASGTIKNVALYNLRGAGNGANVVNLVTTNAGSLTAVRATQVMLDASNIRLVNHNLNAALDVLVSNCSFPVTGNVFRNVGGGTAVMSIRSAGTTYPSTPCVRGTTELFALYGWDIPGDPLAAYMATTNGQFMTSTNATANKQGPAVRAFSINAWYALATGAAGVNTAI